MIPIDKPEDEPERLQSDGADERADLADAYEDENTDFVAVLSERGFDRTIFSHDSVRSQLLDCQHEKCCYCEKGREHVHEVEHFRPKTAVRQDRGEPRERPGYYWLAYEWANLLMACRHCNGRKGTIFPLRNPENRARSHEDELEDESPLLLRPDQEDPTDHLTFREHVVVGESDRGQTSVDVLGLNREKLKRDRRERYAALEDMHLLAQLDLPQSVEARQKLERATAPDAEFSAMATAAIEADFDVT
jgi:uncharacterized protein (TIGR02646 family)